MEHTDSIYEVIQVPQTTNVRFGIMDDPVSYIPNHWHRAIEIIYVMEGTLSVTVGSQTDQLCSGDCILINSRDIHNTNCLYGQRSVLIQIPDSFMEKYIPDISRLSFLWNCRTADPVQQSYLDKIKRILQQMQILDADRPDGFLLKFNSLLFDLLSLIYTHFRVKISYGDMTKRLKNINRLEPVLQYTNDSYKTSVSIEEIAKVAGFQPEYFCRFFKKHMGITYLEYLNQIRLSHIYQDLITTDASLHQILDQHGFTNYKLFRRMFWEHFKETPGTVRKNLKEYKSQFS